MRKGWSTEEFSRSQSAGKGILVLSWLPVIAAGVTRLRWRLSKHEDALVPGCSAHIPSPHRWNMVEPGKLELALSLNLTLTQLKVDQIYIFLL